MAETEEGGQKDAFILVQTKPPYPHTLISEALQLLKNVTHEESLLFPDVLM